MLLVLYIETHKVVSIHFITLIINNTLERNKNK